MSTAAIQAGHSVLLDSDALVYFLERHASYGPPARDIMRRVQEGELAAVVSTLAITEVLVYPYRKGQPEVARGMRRLLERFANLEIVGVDRDIADTAARLRAKHRLYTADAIQVATGLERGADWFVTNDRGIRRVADEGIGVWLFDDHLDAKT